MAYARINTITFTSEEAADELQAIYASTAPAGFPEAQLLVSVRTGPLTASLTSIYEDKAAFDRSAEERTKRMAANGHLIHGVVVEEGEVTLFHTK
jgi:hypothetical protein